MYRCSTLTVITVKRAFKGGHAGEEHGLGESGGVRCIVSAFALRVKYMYCTLLEGKLDNRLVLGLTNVSLPKVLYPTLTPRFKRCNPQNSKVSDEQVYFRSLNVCS